MGICEVGGCNREVWYMYKNKEIRMVCEYHNMDLNEGKKLKFKSDFFRKNNYLSKKYNNIKIS